MVHASRSVEGDVSKIRKEVKEMHQVIGNSGKVLTSEGKGDKHLISINMWVLGQKKNEVDMIAKKRNDKVFEKSNNRMLSEAKEVDFEAEVKEIENERNEETKEDEVVSDDLEIREAVGMRFRDREHQRECENQRDQRKVRIRE